MISEIIVGVLGTLIGGFGVTIYQDHLKNKNEIKKEQKENFKNSADFRMQKANFLSDDECDMIVFGTPIISKVNNEEVIFKYPEEIKNKAEYIFHDYIFINVGNSYVSQFDLVTNNQKTTTIFDYKDIEYYISEPFINYNCLYDKIIDAKEELKIRIYYNKDNYFVSNFSSCLSILYVDQFKNCWVQSFFEDKDKLYPKRRISYKEHKSYFDTITAIECFKEPSRW